MKCMYSGSLQQMFAFFTYECTQTTGGVCKLRGRLFFVNRVEEERSNVESYISYKLL